MFGFKHESTGGMSADQHAKMRAVLEADGKIQPATGRGIPVGIRPCREPEQTPANNGVVTGRTMRRPNISG